MPTNATTLPVSGSPSSRVILLLTLLLSLLAAGSAQAQQATDLIVRTNNATIKAKVTRVNATEIEYHRADNPNGPLYTISRAEVAVIVYANGTSEVMSIGAPPAPGGEGPARAAPAGSRAARGTGPPAAPAAPAGSSPAEPPPAAPKPPARLTAIDVYSVNYAGSEYSEFGIAAATIKRNKVGLEFGLHFQTGSSASRAGFSYALTSPLRARSAFIPFYRVGVAVDYLFLKNFTGTSGVGIVGGGIAARLGERDKFIRLGFEYAGVYTYLTDSVHSASSTDGAYVVRLGVGL